MWAQGRFRHMADFVARAQALGFSHIEAHSSLSPEMLDELVGAPVPISSVHSPCPVSLSSKGIPVASLSLCSTEEAERREAVNVTKKTIDLASRVGAGVVIIHMGEVPVNADLEESLRRLYQEGLANSKMYLQLREQLASERSSKAPRNLERAGESLNELSQYGKARGVRLGLENRVYFREMPDIDEMDELLSRLEADSVGYWHDVGHAVVQERLGFAPHREWLLRFSHRMIGVHLHDVIGISDHQVPGRGDADWSMLASYLPQQAIRTCEVNQWNGEELLREAVPFLLSAGIVM